MKDCPEPIEFYDVNVSDTEEFVFRAHYLKATPQGEIDAINRRIK